MVWDECLTEDQGERGEKSEQAIKILIFIAHQKVFQT